MFEKAELFRHLLIRAEAALNEKPTIEAKLKTLCRLLRDNVSYYKWVGLYIVDTEKTDELVLGPFAGEPTEHTRIPFGRGICGQAASHKKTFVVQDVSKENNYLACSSKVKSEIVVPVFKENLLVGELEWQVVFSKGCFDDTLEMSPELRQHTAAFFNRSFSQVALKLG